MLRALTRFDLTLTLCILLLSALGLTILSSVAPALLNIQIIAVVIGLICYIIISQTPCKLWHQLNRPLYIICLVFLCLPFMFGTAAGGSLRWLQLGLISIQPSEIVRPFLIAILAGVLSRPGAVTFNDIFKSSLLILPPMVIIFLQPDLDMVVILGIAWIAMILSKGLSKKQITAILLVVILFSPLAWKIMHGYQKDRILTFLNPGRDPLNTGYHVLQSQIAVGSGQIFGRGLGRGTQSHLRFLPERHTDFVFASLAEELGLVGTLLVLIFYLILSLGIIKAIQTARDDYSRLLASGVLAATFFQIVINIGMNLGLLPVTGITLPLLSYGGSSVISTCISLGLINNILSRRSNTQTLRIH